MQKLNSVKCKYGRPPDKLQLIELAACANQTKLFSMSCNKAVPDTYAESHIGSTETKPGAAAHKTAQNNTDKYSKLASTHTHTDRLL